MATPTFTGIWLPLITPFRNGRVDLPALQALTEHYITAGIHGLIVGGTTGEPATMSEAEQEAALDAVLESAGGRCPVLAGLSGNDTQALLNRLPVLERRPIAGLLSVAPYYTRPSQAGLIAHFGALAEATALPIVLYNIPYRTGVNLELATVQALCAHANIAGIKESGGNMSQLMDLIEHTRLSVLSGEDHLIYTTLALGGQGAISAAAHLYPERYVQLYAATQAGDWLSARELARQLRPLVEALFSEPNPGPIKAVLARAGWIAEELRLPMTPVSAASRERVWSSYQALAAQ